MIRLIYCLLLTIIVNLNGCNLRPEYSLPAVHDLGPRSAVSNNSSVTWSTTRVDAPVWLWDDQIHYRLLYANPSQVRFYSRDRWIAPPPSMLESYFSSGGKQPDFSLRIRLRDFEQQFETPNQARVILFFDVQADSLNDSRTIFKRAFRLQQQTETADALGAVNSFTALSQQAVTDIQIWLEKLNR